MRRFLRMARWTVLPLGGAIALCRFWDVLPDGKGRPATFGESVLTGLTVTVFGAALLVIGFGFLTAYTMTTMDHPRYAFHYSNRQIKFDQVGVEEVYESGIRTYTPWSEILYAGTVDGITYLVFAGQNVISVPDEIFTPEATALFHEQVSKIPRGRTA